MYVLTLSLLVLLCLVCWRLLCLIGDDVCCFGLGLLFLFGFCY